MKLKKEEILIIQKNRDPFLMVDEITNVQPGERIVAKKFLDKNLWFFKVHWPGDPNMPGVLQVECMTQACAMIIQTMEKFNNETIYITAIDKAIFKQKVTPGGELEIRGEIISSNRGIVKCKAETIFKSKLASKAQINIIIPSQLNKFTK